MMESSPSPEHRQDSLTTVRLCITGLVQGVGYRSFARRVAGLHHVTGYVKNLPDGRVQVFARGSKECLEDLICELKKGPFMARVEEIQVEWNPVVYVPYEESFAIL